MYRGKTRVLGLFFFCGKRSLGLERKIPRGTYICGQMDFGRDFRYMMYIMPSLLPNNPGDEPDKKKNVQLPGSARADPSIVTCDFFFLTGDEYFVQRIGGTDAQFRGSLA